MTSLNLAYRNTYRSPKRTILTVLAICIAVASITFMDAYMRGAYNSFLETFIQLDAGHVKIMPEEAVNRSRLIPLEDGISDVDKVVAEIEKVDGILEVAPRIKFGVLLDKPGGSIPAIGIAMVPSREKTLINPGQYLVEGYVPADDSNEVLIGDRLARELGLSVGDELFFVARDIYDSFGPGVYTVSGLVRTGVATLDKKTFYVPLKAAQEQLAMEDMAMEIVCRVKDGMEKSEGVAIKIQDVLKQNGWDSLSAVAWKYQGNLYQMLEPTRIFYVIMVLIFAIVALTTVINTVLMSVMERRQEIGTLRAMGFDQLKVVKLISLESLLIGIVSSILGVVIGMVISIWLNHQGIDLSKAFDTIEIPMQSTIYPDPKWYTALISGFTGLVISIVAAWYPARVATRMSPVAALRAE